MKILFLANRVPYPPFRGDKLKIFNLANQLMHEHELHLLTFALNEEDWQHQSALEKVFSKIIFVNQSKAQSLYQVAKGLLSNMPLQVLYFKNKEMQSQLDALVQHEQYDVVHVQHIRMAQYLRKHQIPAILDLPDAFSLYWQRRQKFAATKLHRLVEQVEQKRLYRYEKEIIKGFPLTLVCSPEDQRYLKEQHSIQNVSILPNGVDVSKYFNEQHHYEQENVLLFTGNMDYAPNVDAVTYFVDDIFPLILQQHPKVKFIIAGQRPVPKVLALARENITVTGFVENLNEVYQKATVVVAPLRFGAGTQNKVLEAMAMGVPVVCSNVGFEGLLIQQGEGAFCKTDKESFAEQVIELLNNVQLRQQVGVAGQAAIHQRFSWEKVAQQLNGYFKAVTNH